jgi:hypothetical protein
MKRILATALFGLLLAQFAAAQTQPADLEADAAALRSNAANPVVAEDLAEPDGVSLALAEDGSYQIFARGTGTYDFGDEDDRQEALQEAILKAKANLAKFLNETIASDESAGNFSKKAKTLTNDGSVTSAAVSKEQVKTQTTAIRNSSQAILTGAITLETRRIPGSGDGGTYQVTVGVSSKTIAAAESIAKRMAQSLANRRPGAGGTGAAVSPAPTAGNGGMPNTPEVRKANTLF